MKSFNITLEDLRFLKDQVNVPIIEIVRYEVNGTPIYGYTVPEGGFTDPLTGLSVTNDPFTNGNPLLPGAGQVVELGVIGTFDVFNTAWSLFLPPVVTANGTTAAGVGEPFGLRNVQGLFNNIALPNAAIWGAAFYSFARNSAADYDNYLQQRLHHAGILDTSIYRVKLDSTGNPDTAAQNQVGALSFGLDNGTRHWNPANASDTSVLSLEEKALLQDSTYGVTTPGGEVNLQKRYANPFLTVYDYTPRMISQTVDSQEALLRMEAAGAGIITDNEIYQIKDINTGEFKIGGHTADGTATGYINGNPYITSTNFTISPNGQSVTVRVQTSEAITVSNTSGPTSPRYVLNITGIPNAATTRYASYQAGESTSTSLVFRFTLGNANNNLNNPGISISSAPNPFDFRTSTIRDSSGNDLFLSDPGFYFTENFARNLNTLSGDPTLSGWNTLFGQFFDHGLDFIGKGGNTINGVSSKVYIPLAETDPLYRAPGTYGTNDPGNTKLYISRATVENPEAAGANGMFQTADDIQSPGADGVYGTTDDVIGPTNPNYINHTSPYIDQSQTYGSDDNVTNLLRQWVEDPNNPGQFMPGMYLFDGNTLQQSWNRQNPDGTITETTRTLPTLNELRAELLRTGRADLTWEDISNLRVRDNQGQILDLDPNTAGIQAKYSEHTLIADFLPRLDSAHINAAGLTAMSSLFPSYTGNIADYVDINTAVPG